MNTKDVGLTEMFDAWWTKNQASLSNTCENFRRTWFAGWDAATSYWHVELDPPVCRLQFPDGSVPGNAREAAEGWKKWADDWREALRKTIAERDKLKEGRLDDNTEKEIAVRAEVLTAHAERDEYKRRAEFWERLHDERARENEVPNRRKFDDELVCLINKYSKENGSNTPDFILAEYLMRCLESSDMLIRGREEWYGREFSPGSLRSHEEEQPDHVAKRCPDCGYTQDDALFYGDHHLCTGKIPKLGVTNG